MEILKKWNFYYTSSVPFPQFVIPHLVQVVFFLTSWNCLQQAAAKPYWFGARAFNSGETRPGILDTAMTKKIYNELQISLRPVLWMSRIKLENAKL